MKRVITCGDMHCGHKVGLTPPEWQYHPSWKDAQAEMWRHWEDKLRALKPIDVLICNGDLIDGRGERSGSTELLEVSPLEQCQMAVRCIAEAEAKHVVLTYGTPYHAGQLMDFEDEIYRDVSADEIGGEVWVDVEGVTFNVRHKVGGSVIPHGRHTQVERDRLWNILWNEHSGHPKADVILRSHVHYFAFSGGKDHISMTLPALQGLGSKFGVRQCSGTVDFGFVHWDCQQGGYSWQPHTREIETAKPEVTRL